MTFQYRPITIVDLELSACSLDFNEYPCGNTKTIEDSDDATEWAAQLDATTVSDAVGGGITFDKAGVAEVGARALKVVDEFDLNDASQLHITVTVADAATLAKIADVRVALQEDAGASLSRYVTLAAALVEGANDLVLTVGSPTTTLGTPDRKGIDGLYFTVITNNVADTLAADDIVFGPLENFVSAPLTAAPCYNTRTTCRAVAYYQGTTSTVRLLPAHQERPKNIDGFPCVTGVTTLPTKIDINGGLGEAGRVTITCDDWVGEHVTLDPYHRQRKSKYRSSFWATLKARNKHYSGRYLYVREAMIDEHGLVDIDSAVVRQYVIERIEGPDNTGRTRIIAKDLTTRLSSRQIPVVTSGELNAAINDAAVALTLKAGAVGEYVRRDGAAPTAGNPIYLRIDDEIIKCEEVDGDELKSLTRAQFSTTAAAHAGDAAVQLCRVWSAVAVETIWQEILEDVGTDSTLIDTAAAATEATAWFGGYAFTACISEPTTATELMRSLMHSAAALTWWDAESQTFRLKGIHPPSPTDVVYGLDEEAHIVGSSLSVADDHALRISRAQTYLGVRNWSLPLNEKSTYERQVVAIDVSAETDDEYGEVRDVDTVWGYWIPASLYTEATAATQRRLVRRRDGVVKIKLRVTEKDASGVDVGEVASVTAAAIVDESGAETATQAWVLSKRRVRADGIEYEYELQAAGGGGDTRPAFWAADGLANYDDATDGERLYAYWGEDNDTVGINADDAYTWV